MYINRQERFKFERFFILNQSMTLMDLYLERT